MTGIPMWNNGMQYTHKILAQRSRKRGD